MAIRSRKRNRIVCGLGRESLFFTHDEIEFDIDPREVQGQSQLDALLAFLRFLSDATGRDEVLTPENCPEIVVFRAHPNHLAVEYHEFGGWKPVE